MQGTNSHGYLDSCAPAEQRCSRGSQEAMHTTSVCMYMCRALDHVIAHTYRFTSSTTVTHKRVGQGHVSQRSLGCMHGSCACQRPLRRCTTWLPCHSQWSDAQPQTNGKPLTQPRRHAWCAPVASSAADGASTCKVEAQSNLNVVTLLLSSWRMC